MTNRIVTDINTAIQGLLDAERFGSVVTFVQGPHIGDKAVVDADGSIMAGSVPDDVSSDVIADAMTLMGREQHRALDYGEHSVFIETLAPPPDLLIFGAVHIGQAVASFGTQMGYRVTVVDSRNPFVTEERFPTAHRLLVGWPRDLMDQLNFDRRTWVVVLSHDPRHETPPLEAALKSDTRYIGAMGSRRTHNLRVERLRELGFGDDDIARIHSPIGLDIGAETPHEVAVSILAEMTLERYGAGTGLSLRGTEGRVHKQRKD
ncbi:MAG TPA: XdhC family protein [Acidimicrobiia bacterium]|nr:XdhC family protein [Acidimicrobiia bacterium]